MQFKSFMEALKGKQHKIDKNKNGQIDAQDFKLLQKEETEQLEEGLDPSEVAGNPRMYSADTVKKAYYHKSASASDKESLARHLDRHHGNKEWRKPVKEESEIEESEERMARADYKVGTSGRKSHKEIVFNDAESKDDEDDKKEMKEAKMSDADMAERERIVKGMKKNLASFTSRYGKDAKSVMYATATKQAMKEETVEEAVQKADIPAYLRKQQGQTPLKLSDLKRKDTISDKENLAKLRNEELDETFINGRDYASHGLMHPDHAKWQSHRVGVHTDFYAHGTGDKINGQVVKNDGKEVHIKATKSGGGKLHKFKVTPHLPQQQNEEKKDDVPFDGPYTKTKPTKNSDGTTQSPMSRARDLAKQAMKQKMKEEFDIEMSDDQADSILDYIDEQAPVAPVPDRKYIRGTPEHKAYKATKKPINGMPTNVKEETALDEVEKKTLSYGDFITNLLEYESKDGVYRNKGTYGGNYVDPEGADDADDKKPMKPAAEKRGRGRPAGAKSGARKITGTSKLFK